MARCPKCGKPISRLINYVNNITEVFELTADSNGEPEYKHIDTLYFTSDSFYLCPECGEELFDNEEDAVNFLKND